MRLHVNLKVADLDESVRFYSSLFKADPSVQKTDYAKWSLDDPSVNFSVVANGSTGAGIEHLGIEASSPEELSELRQRIDGLHQSRAQSEVLDEGHTVCCYHQSDKTWVTDTSGVSWEAFYTSGEADTLKGPATGAGEAEQAACCEDSCCS